MGTVKNVWVFAEKIEGLGELCAGGRTLGEKVTAVVWGAQSEAEQAIKMGADEVYWLGEKDAAKMLEDYTLTMMHLVKEKKPDLFLLSTTKRCKLLAGRLAANLGTSAFMDVIEFEAKEGTFFVKKMVYGGAAMRTETALSGVSIATVGVGVFNKLPEDPVRQGTIEKVAIIETSSKIKCLEKRTKGGESIDLAAAKRVVAVGRGLASQEDLTLIKELAEAIGAEVGCTRPMAEGVNWLPRERYIGVSGVMFKPELYFGIGVSGQIQHMVGCNQARTIVAINKDKAAPIFQQADYGVIGDLYKVVPALIKKIKASKL